MTKVYIVFREEQVTYNNNPNCSRGSDCGVCNPKVYTAYGEQWPEKDLPFKKASVFAVRFNPRDAYQIAQDEEDHHGETAWVEEYEAC